MDINSKTLILLIGTLTFPYESFLQQLWSVLYKEFEDIGRELRVTTGETCVDGILISGSSLCSLQCT